MLKVLIVDDEPLARERLKRLIDAADDCVLVGEAGTADEARSAIDDATPDVVLLDISMPGASGMQLARELKARDDAPVVVFCTAHPERALDAFEAAALDYLVKPVRAERLEETLSRVRRSAGDEDDEQFLRSTVGTREILIPLSDVICLLAEDKYTTVVFADGRAVVNDSLVQIEEAHPQRFFRVHRGCLVSRRHVRGLERVSDGGHVVLLTDTDERPEISRRKLPAVRRLIREQLS